MLNSAPSPSRAKALGLYLGRGHAQKWPSRTGPGGDKDLRAAKMGYKGCPSGVCVYADTHTQDYNKPLKYYYTQINCLQSVL